MTRHDFLTRLAGVLAAGLLLAGMLRLGLGGPWFSFYGWATVALATAVAVSILLWLRLPMAGWSRWWSLLVAVPAALAAGVQIGFWVSFFRVGGSNPMLGVAREMVRPWLDAGSIPMIALWLAVAVWLVAKAARGSDGA